MSIFIFNNFVGKRGIHTFTLFSKMLNSKKNLSEIAVILNISIARVSVLKDQLFDVKYIPKPWVCDQLNTKYKAIEDEHNSLIEVLRNNE